MRVSVLLLIILLSLVPAFAQSQAASIPHFSDTARQQADTQAIQKIEDDLLKAERTTDPAVMEIVLVDDYVNLTPEGVGPGKADIVKNHRAHAGQALPYSVETKDMRIYILGDTAIAAYVKTYTARENGNVAHEDVTHIFTRINGAWKLRISKASNCLAN